MDFNSLRQKSVSELKTQLLDLRGEQFSLRMQKSSGQLNKTQQMRSLRRDVARIKTLLGGNK